MQRLTLKKPNLNNDWGREISNQLRSYLNLPPVAAHENAMFNTVIGDDKFLLTLEPAADEDVALLSMFRKTDSFSATRHLDNLLQQTSINKNLPAPVHVALKGPDTVVIMVRIHRQASNQAVRYLDLLITIYNNAEATL